MVTRNVFLSTSRCHSEQSEESGVASRYNEPGWCFRSFADAQDDKRDAQDDKRDGQEDKGTVGRTKGRKELSFDIVFCAIGFIFRICQPALQIAEYFPFIPIVALPQHRLQFISCFTEPDMVLPV